MGVTICEGVYSAVIHPFCLCDAAVVVEGARALNLLLDDTTLLPLSSPAAYDEADRALGRGGLQSFVLEGVVGELQDR